MVQYEVVAYTTTRQVLTIEADSKEEAKQVAEGIECVSNKWVDDFEYHNFEIKDVQRVPDE